MSRRKPIEQGGYWYMQAIGRSDLPPPARLVALTLAGIANTKTGQVREEVSLSKLEGATGHGRSTIARVLNELESRDWLLRRRPPKWAQVKEHATTRYVLTIPAAHPANRDEFGPVRPSPTAGLGLVPYRDELVPEMNGASPTAGHSDYRNYTGGGGSAGATPPTRLTTQPPQPGEEAPHLYVDSGQYDDDLKTPYCLCGSVPEAALHQVMPHVFIDTGEGCLVCGWGPGGAEHAEEPT